MKGMLVGAEHQDMKAPCKAHTTHSARMATQ